MPLRTVKSFLSAFMEKPESFHAARKTTHAASRRQKAAEAAPSQVGNRPNQRDPRSAPRLPPRRLALPQKTPVATVPIMPICRRDGVIDRLRISAMVTWNIPVRRRSPAALSLLAVVLTGTAASAQQPAPVYRGPTPRQTPRAEAAIPAQSPRMGMLEFTPRRVDSSGHIVVVGGVAKSMVVRSQRATASLDAVIQRAGGLSREATGAVTIIRHGQPRMNLFYTPGAGTTVVPGDTVIVSARSATPSAPEPTTAGRAAPVAIICHNVQPQPAILWVPEGQASVEGITRALGQSLAAIPPRGVVLTAARPTISPDMLLSSGTSLYFEPTQIDRARLAQSLAAGLRFDDVVELEPATASVDLPPPAAAKPPVHVPFSGPDPSLAHLLVPTTPAAPTNPAGADLSFAPPTTLPTAPLLPVTTALPAGPEPQAFPAAPVPLFEPERVQSTSSQQIELVRSSSAAGASLQTVDPDKPSPDALAAPHGVDELNVLHPDPPVVNRLAFGWGLAAGVLVGSLVGVYLWIRSRPKTKLPPGVADLPVSEEPANVRPQPLHGKVVGDRRLAFDGSHERLSGPHFGASRQAHRRPLVRTAGGRTGPTEATPAQSPSDRPRGADLPAPNGLLDRILRAMQRERGE
jgi:hypothetical protein